MKIRSNSFVDGGAIPERLAFGRPEPGQHVVLSDNRNPHLAWSDLPMGTQSLALVCHDPDVPSRPDDVNQEGRSVPADLPRVDFFHWLLVDLDPARREIAEGEFSSGITARGKPGPDGPHGTRQGLNDYTGWFAGVQDMDGSYFGYDGPCPPWNDSIEHRYVFTLYALDAVRCPIDGAFDGAALCEVLRRHTLAEASITGTYTLNPALRAAA